MSQIGPYLCLRRRLIGPEPIDHALLLGRGSVDPQPEQALFVCWPEMAEVVEEALFGQKRVVSQDSQ